MITVLAGTNGGLIVRMKNADTGEVMSDLLTRDAAETFIAQARATLRCAPLEPHAKAERPQLMTRDDERHESLSGRR